MKWFSIAIMSYILIAFVWWTMLLLRRNHELLELKTELAAQHVQGRPSSPGPEFSIENELESARAEYYRVRTMVISEAFVFSLTLIAGFWIIYRGFRKEMNAARQQKNFLLSITHELKSPVASIMLTLETLQKRKLTPEQKQKMLDGSLSETHRLDGLINDILLAARIDSAYQPDFESANLNDVVFRAVENFKSKNPHVQVNFSPGNLSNLLLMDRNGLFSALINLLENAEKYNFKKDKNVWIKTACENQEFLIEIADDGTGIPDSEKKRIFKKFYRIGNEETRRTKGTGLGLYIVNEIAKKHEGRIVVKNNHPHGTIFRIYLPEKSRQEIDWV